MFVNKKILLSTIIPLISSLGFIKNENSEKEYKIMVNYNGQADVLLSLQIPTDYYPYQFKKTTLYDYLTNVDKYIVSNQNVSQEKVKIKNNLQNKLNQLLSRIKEFGPSLWNEDLYETGIVFRNDQFWNSKKTSLLFLEQFIADDYVDISDSYHLLPAHKTLIITNYRAARDPFTIFSQEIFKCFETSTCNNDMGKEFKRYMNNYNLTEINSLYRFGKYIGFWNKLSKLSDISTHIEKFTSQTNKLFSLDDKEDKKISEKYKQIIFSKEELEKLKEWSKTQEWNMNYQNQDSIKLTHHPALEQQIIPGTAPLAEGSQKDIMIFLYQFATLINEYIKQPVFKSEFKNDYRKVYMENALKNAKTISENANTRISNIRTYFKKINVVDNSFDPEKNCFSTTNSKTFGIVTYPPSSFGAGEATIQSMSKFPFIYRDIGLKQPIPTNLNNDNPSEDQETFSVDDNGWWWKIGNINLDASQLMSFSKTSDTILILANEDDWNILRDDSSNTLKAISEINKEKEFILDISKINTIGYSVHYQKYHLWNEGLRSPLALNLLLDNLVDIFQKQYDSSMNNSSEYRSAMDWGNYWDNTFISEIKQN